MLWQYLTLLVAHWVGDFVLQTHWQATNKSKNNLALAMHVAVYSTVLTVPAVILFGRFAGEFTIANGVIHFGVDYVTSRINSRLWTKGDVHNFFVCIGFDQLLHQATLAVTLWLFLEKIV